MKTVKYGDLFGGKDSKIKRVSDEQADRDVNSNLCSAKYVPKSEYKKERDKNKEVKE